MEWLGCHGYSYTSLTEDPLTVWKGPAILFVIIKLECVEYRKIRSGFLFFLAICKRKGVEEERHTVSGMFLKCVRHVSQKMLNSFSAARQTKSKQLFETGDVNVRSLPQAIIHGTSKAKGLFAPKLFGFMKTYSIFPGFIPIVK